MQLLLHGTPNFYFISFIHTFSIDMQVLNLIFSRVNTRRSAVLTEDLKRFSRSDCELQMEARERRADS